MVDVINDVIINYKSVGLDKVGKEIKDTSVSLDGLVVSAAGADKATASMENRFKSLERSLGTTSGQQQKFEKAQRDINNAVAQNPALQGRANEALAAAEAKYLSGGKAITELAAAHKGLDAQGQAAFHSVRSVVEQLALGIPPTQALTGQINHLTFAASGEGGLSGAFSQVGSFVGRMITPMTVAIGTTAALAAGAAYLALQYDKVQVSSQRAISGAGARTGTTVSDLNDFVGKNASVSTTGLSDKEVRSLGEAFTATGEIVVSRLHGMSDAVVGFANQTGKSVTEASKEFVQFGTDPKKALDELSATYGNFDVATRKAVDALVQADDKTGAFNVILDALAEKSKAAAQNMTLVEQAGRGLTTLLGKTAPGTGPSGLESQLEAARSKLNAAIEQGTSGNSVDRGFASIDVPKLSREFETLQAAMEKVKAQNISAEFNKLSTAADGADRALISQISAIEQLKTKIEELNRAQAGGASSKYGANVDSAALQAAQNQLAALEESQAEAARYNQRVAEISKSWGDVGQSTALSLQAAQNQLPVLEAVGGRAKMAAQYTADYKNAIDAGKTSAEAAALAGSHLAAAQAQVNSAAKETLAGLRDQAAVSGAVTGNQQIQAQSQATYNNLLRQGVDASTASAIAAQEEANARAKATAEVLKQTHSLEQSTELMIARENGNEAEVKSAQAYQNAIDSGASRTAAAALSAATLANELTRAAIEAAKVEQSAIDAANGTENGIVTLASKKRYEDAHALKPGKQYTSTSDLGIAILKQHLIEQFSASPSFSDSIDQSYQNSGLNSALTYAKGQKVGPAELAQTTNGGGGQVPFSAYGLSDIATKPEISQSDLISQVSTLYGLKNAQTNDPSVQRANLKEEMAWLQTLPETIARDQSIISLQQSIDALKGATDANTAATSATLNPLYSQGHGALAIGYYKAASGLDLMAQGPTSGDQVPFHAMVNGGERIQITPAGKSANNDNSRTVVNNNNFVFNNTNTSNARRSQRQFAQGFGQLAAAGS